MLRIVINLIIIFFITATIHAQSVVINEVMPANASTIADGDGDFPDWLEIYNAGAQPVNLNGWALSDEADQPQKWLFPSYVLDTQSFLLVFASNKDRRETLYWETVFNQADTCRYLRVTQAVANWNSITFSDGGWSIGKTGIGYGDGDDATMIASVNTVYLRKTFYLSDTTQFSRSFLHVDYDDGFVAYLNGFEVSRANMGTPGTATVFNQSADQPREAEMYQGGLPQAFDLTNHKQRFRIGKNVLAIEVHNYGSSSSDLSLIPFLTLGFKSEPEPARGGNPLLQLPAFELHTNFKIDAQGECLFLRDSLGVIADSLIADSIPTGISRGRQPDGAADWLYFNQPTPGLPNTTPGYIELAPLTTVSPAAGFYRTTIVPQLSCPDSTATIRYTLNGADPDSASLLYQKSSNILINKTTVLKARAFSKEGLAGPVQTATYFINETSALPVISISTTPANLWDYNTGIYVMGPNADPAYPYFGANFWQPWERPAHIEFFENDDSYGFDAPCGIQIFGQWSRAFPQKSMAVFFRAAYGQGKLDYPLFPQLDFDQYESFVLRNGGNDYESTHMRDGMMHTLLDGVDVDRQAYRPVVVFLNGQYWGVHDMREKLNENYLRSHHQVDPENLDILENNQAVLNGDGAHYANMMRFIETHNMADTASYSFIAQQINLTEFMDYFIAQIYFDNTDWPGNNIRYWRPHSDDGKWRWLLYDTDFGFGLYDASGYAHNTLQFATATNGPDWPNPPWSTYLLRKLLENPRLRDEFISRFASHLNITFREDQVVKVIDSLQQSIIIEMPRHAQRWSRDYNYWLSEVSRLRTFAKNRPANVRSHLRSQFNLSGTWMLKLTVQDQQYGHVQVGGMNIPSASWYGHYFNNVPLTIEAIAQPGYQFVGWIGTLTSSESRLTISGNQSLDLSAQFTPVVISEGAVVINEINYHSAVDFDADDWIELYNNGDQTFDCNGWKLQDEDSSHVFEFPTGSKILPDSFLVIVRDKLKFSTLFPGISNIIGDLPFGFSAGGDQVRLYDAHAALIDSLQFDDAAPWPLQADGSGSTLELKNPKLDNTQAENWQASSGHGTPNRRNSAWVAAIDDELAAPPLRFSLAQNYPNPFNASTKIEFELPERSKVELEIFDITGKRVSMVLNKMADAGRHALIWQAPPQLASGLYFYQLKINGRKNLIRKMVLIR